MSVDFGTLVIAVWIGFALGVITGYLYALILNTSRRHR